MQNASAERAIAGDQLLLAARNRADALTKRRLVLYAGANLPSAAVAAAYAPGLSAMPAMGPRFDKEQPDTALVSALETLVAERACALFGAAFAEVRLPNATLANLALFHALAKPGDLMLAPAAAHGGHLSQRAGGTPELAGLATQDLPFDAENLVLDAAAAADQVRRTRPALIMLGRSVMLAADDVVPVCAAAREVGAITIFDASHVAGLIAGGTYPNPLAAGADVMVMSTYKTIPGRPHALVVGRDPAHGARLAALIDRAFLANYDAGRLPQLLMTLEEVAREGAEYARRTAENTAALGAACRNADLPVRMADAGHTHQFLIPIDSASDPRSLIAGLAERGVVVGTSADIARSGGSALRVGTQFLARLGLGPESMPGIAGILADLLEPAGTGVRLADPAPGIDHRIESLLGGQPD